MANHSKVTATIKFTTDNAGKCTSKDYHASQEELIQKLITAEQTANNQAKCYVPGFV